IAAGQDGALEIAAFRRAERRAIARAEALLEVVRLTALRTGFGGGVHVIDRALVGDGRRRCKRRKIPTGTGLENGRWHPGSSSWSLQMRVRVLGIRTDRIRLIQQ